MDIMNVEIMRYECGTREEYVNELIEGMNEKHKGKYLFESRIVDALNDTKIHTIIAFDVKQNEIFQLPIEDAYQASLFMGKDVVFEKINHKIEQFEEFYSREDCIETEKQAIQPWIIGKGKNQDWLQKCPYTEYGDYVIVYRKCTSFNDYQLNYGLITWENAEKLSLDLLQLHELAMQNVQNTSLYTIVSYNGCFFEEIGDFTYRIGNEYEEYIVRGVEENYSTGSLFNKEIWKNMGNLIGENYYIIPSSVHEWIVMSISMTSKELLETTIAGVNTELNPEDLLGEQYYLYDVEKDEMILMKSQKDE